MAEVPVQPVEEEVEDRSEVEDEEVGESVRYVISSYGADYPVDGLVKRIKRGDVYVPEFQRGYVWSVPCSSRPGRPVMSCRRASGARRAGLRVAILRPRSGNSRRNTPTDARTRASLDSLNPRSASSVTQ